jgi:GNAT superfamily N-acetyltransferase
MSVSIRVAVPADSAAVRRVLLASYPALMADAYEPALLTRALPLITRPNPRLLARGTYYLAEAEGEALGCGGWSWNDPGSGALAPGLAHIRHFAVRSSWAGRGVGRALYERCAHEARAAGARRFEALASLNGEPFYAALGFERIGRIEVPMGRGLLFPSILMRREI